MTRPGAGENHNKIINHKGLGATRNGWGTFAINRHINRNKENQMNGEHGANKQETVTEVPI